MRKLSIVCVGGLRETYFREAGAEYAKRLGGFCRFSVIETPEERLPDDPSPAQIRAALAAEGRRLLAKAGGNAARVALCVEGERMSSEELAAFLDRLAVCGQGDAAFFIGGSWGLSEEVKAASRLRLSLSSMTFPHQLARVMLQEQLYRAMHILSGGKYHK